MLIHFVFALSPLYSLNQKLTLTHQQMAADYERLRQEETAKSSKLQELTSVPNNHKLSNFVLKSPINNKQQERIINCLSPKKTPNANLLIDDIDIDEQNIKKIRKNLFNTTTQCYGNLNFDDDCVSSVSVMPNGERRISCKNDARNKSLLSTLLTTIPLALPTLQLHLLLSLTMVLLTHRCPQYLIVL